MKIDTRAPNEKESAFLKCNAKKIEKILDDFYEAEEGDNLFFLSFLVGTVDLIINDYICNILNHIDSADVKSAIFKALLNKLIEAETRK